MKNDLQKMAREGVVKFSVSLASEIGNMLRRYNFGVSVEVASPSSWLCKCPILRATGGRLAHVEGDLRGKFSGHNAF